MSLFEMTGTDFQKIAPTTFGEENIKERQDIQRILRSHISDIAPGCMVLAEEYSNWEDSQRRIDLLCLDKSGNLVVVEFKRDLTGHFSELQALRYAAMVSTMSRTQAVEALEQYLAKNPDSTNCSASEKIREFLDEEETTSSEDKFNNDVKILLVSSGFSRELTTTVMWLRDYDIDIRCLRMTPYRHEGKLLIHTEQVLPLPEAEEYQIKIATKRAEERSFQARRSEFSKESTFAIAVCGKTFENQQFEQAVFAAIRSLNQCGIPLEKIKLEFPSGRLVSAPGQLGAEAMKAAIAGMKGPKGGEFRATDYYCEDPQLLHESNQTWALRRLSPKRAFARLERLQRSFPDKFRFHEETGRSTPSS